MTSNNPPFPLYIVAIATAIAAVIAAMINPLNLSLAPLAATGAAVVVSLAPLSGVGALLQFPQSAVIPLAKFTTMQLDAPVQVLSCTFQKNYHFVLHGVDE